MTGWIFKRIGWKFFAVGAATAVVGSSVVRPALVAVVKAGMGATHLATSAWQQAKQETTSLMAEASKMRTAGDSDASALAMELRRLREDVASLKAAVTTKS
jgi:hypothetical protein